MPAPSPAFWPLPTEAALIEPHVKAGNTADGSPVDIAQASGVSGNENQAWVLKHLSGCLYTLSPKNATGSCLEVSGSGTAIDIAASTGQPNQHWAIH